MGFLDLVWFFIKAILAFGCAIAILFISYHVARFLFLLVLALLRGFGRSLAGRFIYLCWLRWVRAKDQPVDWKGIWRFTQILLIIVFGIPALIALIWQLLAS